MTDKQTERSSLSPSGLRLIVKRYGEAIGRPELAAHDLRRSYARLSRDGGAPLEVIQASLGHSSIDVTQRYLGTCDRANAGDWIRLD